MKPLKVSAPAPTLSTLREFPPAPVGMNWEMDTRPFPAARPTRTSPGTPDVTPSPINWEMETNPPPQPLHPRRSSLGKTRKTLEVLKALLNAATLANQDPTWTYSLRVAAFTVDLVLLALPKD